MKGLFVDSFAGGGGASTGVAVAIGREPDIAINHSREAIAMHRMNHPTTRHYTENVWKVDPREACGSDIVGGMWLSPDCTHFSRAKGGQPVSRHIRGLAWVAVRWAEAVGPEIFFMENVPEFMTWGPIGPDGRPCSRRKGLTFKQFTGRLRNLGYEVDFKTLRACDYGAPTSRTRFFMVARRDGGSVHWPAPTFGPSHGQPWRSAASCIDWSISCPSIFDRPRPLADNTLRRIAAGIQRFVLDAPKPFIVNMAHGGKVESIDAPMSTIATEKGGCRAIIAPSLIQMGYGEAPGQAPRILDLQAPLGTVVSGGRKHGLVSAFLARHFTGVDGRDLRQPVPTITSIDHHSLVSATLGDVRDRREQVHAFLVAYFGNERDGQSLNDPMRTVTSKERFGLVTVHGVDYAIVDIGMRMLQPRELFNAQSFPPDYEIENGIDDDGEIITLSKTAQVRLCGNSVPPVMAEQIARAQFGTTDVDYDLFSKVAA